ncbi:MAG: vanadium-dependent haloperoxidase [Pricia sp.]
MSKRRENAFATRQLANKTAKYRPHPKNINNDDEQKFRHCDAPFKPSHLTNFTKGLPHDYDTGLISNPDHFQYFVRAIDSGDFRDFRDTPLGFAENCLGHVCDTDHLDWKSDKAKTSGDGGGNVPIRAWESQSAGNSYDLEGPDAQAVTMPPAPKLGSAELDAEMAEIYAQALLRDTPFNAMTPGVTGIGSGKTKSDISTLTTLDALDTKKADVETVKEYTDALNGLDWFKPDVPLRLNLQETIRRRDNTQLPANAFRGIAPGDEIGPYISQFLLAGNSGINGSGGNGPERSPSEGFISYGSASIDQRVRVATIGKDYLTDWDEWFDVQRGADFRGLETYEGSPKRRFIHTPRDLATYVHYDALYQAYLNACLLMLGNGVPFDPGIPFQEGDNRDHQQGFAHFGGPHILSLVTEVATRALKAVRFQKYNVHRRGRPEMLAARIHKADDLKEMAPILSKMKDRLDASGILTKVEAANGADNFLLPMAFCEGSPMHPSYGAGHATVAGACVTILKAFFDHKHPLNIVPVEDTQQEVLDLLESIAPGVTPKSCNLAYVSVQEGSQLDIVPVLDQECELAKLTVEGELNKLASNIAIGRNWAGVHYFTDYYESLLMGEEIAIGILEEQKLTYSENFSMTLAKFDGTTIRI